MTIEEIVKDILRANLAIPDKREIRTTDSFEDDLGADSLDFVELILCFEEELDIEIPDIKAESVKTVEDLIKLITELKTGGQ